MVVGYDNVSEAVLNNPTITSIGIHKEQLGVETIKPYFEELKILLLLSKESLSVQKYIFVLLHIEKKNRRAFNQALLFFSIGQP